MRRLLASWLVLVAALLSRPLATDMRPWGVFPAASAPRVAEWPAAPAVRSAAHHGTFEAARDRRPSYRHYSGSAGAALPTALSPKVPSTVGADRRSPLWSDFVGAWPHGFPYYPTGPPLYLI